MFAVGISACGSSSSSTTSTTSKAKAKAEIKTVDIVKKNLTGVDTQINISSTTNAFLTQHHSSISPVAPASLNYASASSPSSLQSISLPISSGNFVFDKTDHHLTGTIDHVGGFRITVGSNQPISVTDMTINLTTHQALATINGKPDLAMFNLVGTANVAQQGVHTIISGLSLNISSNSPSEIKSALGPSNTVVGPITITATSVK